MGWWDKFKQVAGVAAPIAGAVIPGAQPVAEIVERVIADPDDQRNVAALRQLATRLDLAEQRLARIEKAFLRAGIILAD